MEAPLDMALIVLFVGVAVILSMLAKSASRRLGITPIVGYIAIGVLASVCNVWVPILSENAREVFAFLAKIGVIILLFRVGLESNIAKLLKQLRKASIIWVSDVTVNAGIGFLASYYVLQLDLATSIIIATALTATSVGIPSAVWQENRAIKTPDGQLFLDVAELDDISGVVLMALLFALLPMISGDAQGAVGLGVIRTLAFFAVKLAGFAGFCLFFSRYVERPITGFFRKFENPPDRLLTVIAMGVVIASIAGLLGFSVAIGGFFAGIVFSHDRRSVRIDASFNAIFDLFAPFFFILVGLSLAPASLGYALIPAVVLLAAAAVGKFIGVGAPSSLAIGWTGASLLGVSMIPRAEIAMIIMQRGLGLRDSPLPQFVFSAMVLVSIITCIVAPLFLDRLMKRWMKPAHRHAER
jgi:Kef-type K+ transport system membrane component KefB